MVSSATPRASNTTNHTQPTQNTTNTKQTQHNQHKHNHTTNPQRYPCLARPYVWHKPCRAINAANTTNKPCHHTNPATHFAPTHNTQHTICATHRAATPSTLCTHQRSIQHVLRQFRGHRTCIHRHDTCPTKRVYGAATRHTPVKLCVPPCRVVTNNNSQKNRVCVSCVRVVCGGCLSFTYCCVYCTCCALTDSFRW